MRKIVVFIFFLVSSTICYSQSNRTDSLKREMERNSKKDTVKIRKILDYTNSLNEQDRIKEIPLIKDALIISKELRDTKKQIEILQNLAYIAGWQNKFDETIPYLLEALKLSEDIGDRKKEAKIHFSLSEEYRLFLNDKLRLFHIQKSLEVATAIQDSFQKMSALTQIGYYYDENNEYDKADAYYNKSLKIGKTLKNDLTKHSILQYKAERLEKQKDYTGAININKQLANYSQKSKTLTLEAYAYSQLGKNYTDLRMKDSAYFYAFKSLAFSKKHGLVLELIYAYESLYKSHYVFGDYKKAYDYKVIHDSLFNKSNNYNTSQKVDRVRTQIDQEKKDNLAKIETIKKEAEAKRIRNFQFTIIGFFMLLAGFLYWNNRQKQKAKLKIEKAYSDLKATQSQLIQSEKMASLGELTAGIAHEIQNPLNFVNNFSEVSVELIKEMVDEVDKGNTGEVKDIATDLVNNLEKINHHGKRADAIVKGMLQHSRSSSGQKEPTDINALADEYLRLAYHGLRAKDKTFNATLKTDYDEKIDKINLIPQDIGRVILNLITNAFYAVNEKALSAASAPTAVKYEPTVSVSTKKEGNKVLISVKDNGNGIPQKILDKIFQPFFTTKPTGQGTGLGLSLSYDITKAHGGELKVETKEGEGSTFNIQLPII